MRYHSTEFPITWFKDRHEEGLLILQKPLLQRKLVWKMPQKSHLIESVLMRFPIPEIYIQQKTSPAGTSKFVVVDGQQRIAAILAFLGLKDDDPDNDFELKYVESDSPWQSLSWEDLTEEQMATFYCHLMAVRILDKATDEEVKDLFRRLNKYTTKLSDQEIRNATYTGPVLEMSEAQADSDYWAANRIVGAEDIRRMRDIEFMSELIFGIGHGPQGGSTKAINGFYEAYEEYPDDELSPSAIRRQFKRTLETIQEVLPDIRETRWRNKTDFYTLFVAMAGLLEDRRLPEENFGRFKKSLSRFERRIRVRLADEQAVVSENVIQYVRAVEKGVSDKARRAARQEALLGVIARYFRKRAKPR